MYGNETQSSQTCSGISTKEVTWDNVFLALLVMAMNTALQDAGAVCDGEPAVGPMLRTSPVFCFLDGGYLVTRGLHFLYTERSVRGAHTCLLRLRFQRWPGPNGGPDRVGQNTDGSSVCGRRSRLTIRLVALALSILPIIRFFAMSGLYWSKIIAGMYCIPFFLVELLTICSSNDALTGARNSREHRRGLPSSGVLSPSYISAALAVAFLLYFQASAVSTLFTDPHAHLGQYMGSVALVCWGPVLAFALVMFLYDNDKAVDALAPTLLLLAMLGLPTIFFVFGQHLRSMIQQDSVYVTVCIAGFISWTLVGAQYASMATHPLRGDAAAKYRNNRRDRHRRILEKGLVSWLTLWHLITAIIYLKVCYDPTGTRKPAWTEHLG